MSEEYCIPIYIQITQNFGKTGASGKWNSFSVSVANGRTAYIYIG